MTPEPGEPDRDEAPPPHDSGAAVHVAHLTGMTPEAAQAFVAFHSGLRVPAPRRTP